MTKLTEWLSVFVLLFGLWYCLVTNKFENSFTKQHPNFILYSPILFVGLFGLYSATVVLYRVFTFNDCNEAALELKKEIDEAKSDLASLGFKFKETSK